MRGAGILSGSDKIATSISGSLSALQVVGLGAGVISAFLNGGPRFHNKL